MLTNSNWKPPKEQKLAIFSRHFVTGDTIIAADLTSYSTSVETFGGENITLLSNRTNEKVSIYYEGNYIPVATLDVMASNGVIHVMDNGRFFSEGAGKISQFFIQVILFEIDCTMFLHNFTWIVLSVHKLNKQGKFW